MEIFSYDGHGVNSITGRRLVTFAKKPDSDGGGYILSEEEQDRIGPILAAAPELVDALKDCLEQLKLVTGNGRVHDERMAILKAESTLLKASKPSWRK